MSALTGGHRDKNDHGIMEYCSGQSCNTLAVFRFQSLVSPRNREALLPPPLHTAAELIKTPTFNKTPHYQNNKKAAGKKKPLGHSVQASTMSAVVAGCGTSGFPDANHVACLRVYCIVCILRGPWHLSPVFFQTRLLADLSVLYIKTNICMKTNSSHR